LRTHILCWVRMLRRGCRALVEKETSIDKTTEKLLVKIDSALQNIAHLFLLDRVAMPLTQQAHDISRLVNHDRK
jgi:hypothetical protein